MERSHGHACNMHTHEHVHTHIDRLKTKSEKRVPKAHYQNAGFILVVVSQPLAKEK